MRTDDLVERLERWVQNIGFDGSPTSPPILAVAEIRRLSGLVERLPYVPCPTCGQYSHSIGTDAVAAAFNHFQTIIAHPVRGHPMGDVFDEQTKDAAQLLTAEIRRLRGLVEEAATAFAPIFAHLDKPSGAPGHGHRIAGVWDDDVSNGERAGKPCEWCAQWEAARATLFRLEPQIEGEG